MNSLFDGFSVSHSVDHFGDKEIWVRGHGLTFLVGLSENGDFDSLYLLAGDECVLSLDGEQARNLMLGFSLVSGERMRTIVNFVRNQNEELRKEVK